MGSSSPPSPPSLDEKNQPASGDNDGDANARSDTAIVTTDHDKVARVVTKNGRGDDRVTQATRHASIGQQRKSDAGDVGDAKIPPHAKACAGCQQVFIPLTDGASKTLCRVCQAELRRGR
jgi:hypothetical protein